MPDERGPAAIVERLRDASNAHDLDAIAACFAADYVNETPAHPERGFVGREQVRRNWTMILQAMPDITTEILRLSTDGDTVWSEWEHRGTRPDGSPQVMRGVIIFGVNEGAISSARFYLEPVQEATGTVSDFIRRQTSGAP